MKALITTLAVTAYALTGFSQDRKPADSLSIGDDHHISYACLYIGKKDLARQLNVDVDFGDTEEQLAFSRRYANALKGKTSLAAVLNFMASRKFELIDTNEEAEYLRGGRGNGKVMFIFRKKKH